MNIKQHIGTASIVCSFAFGFTGTAFANVSINETGADYNQKVLMNNDSSVTVDNHSSVQVSNVNIQTANSGEVVANKNTSVGGNVKSGDALNTNAAVTTVAVTNDAPTVVPVGGSGNGGSSSPVSAVGGFGSSDRGNVLGAATVGGFGAGVATLPSVGASMPVDVSALRAAWHPQTNAPTATLAKGSSLFTGFMLITALLLSLLGAIGSAWYSKRLERV